MSFLVFHIDQLFTLKHSLTSKLQLYAYYIQQDINSVSNVIKQLSSKTCSMLISRQHCPPSPSQSNRFLTWVSNSPVTCPGLLISPLFCSKATSDYCAPLWDPQFALYHNKHEAVQQFAARAVIQSWSRETSADDLTQSLNIATRRKKQKVAL